MSVGRDFGPTAWPGHDAQGERIEGEKGVDVKDWGGVMRGGRIPNRCLVLGMGVYKWLTRVFRTLISFFVNKVNRDRSMYTEIPVMKYYIKRPMLSGKCVMEIDKDRFETIRDSRESLIAKTGIEESFNIVIDNYKEFETSAMEIAIDSMCKPFRVGLDFQAWRLLTERRILNLLSSCRMYFDLTNKSLKDCYGKTSDLYVEWAKENSAQYDQSLSYRAMYELRNLAQHKCRSVHSFSMPSRWKSDDEGDRMEVAVAPILDLDYLENNGFKKRVLDELRSSEDLDLRTHLRTYVNGIASLHRRLRIVYDNHLLGWLNEIESANDDIDKQSPDKQRASPDIVCIDDNNDTESYWIGRDLISRHDFHSQMYDPININNRHITGYVWK